MQQKNNPQDNDQDNTEASKHLLIEHKLLSLRAAIYESAQFAVPFALSRVAIAAQNFGNGIIIQKLMLQDAIAAAPVMFMLQQGITGTARGGLSAVNTVVGNLNGQKKFNQIGPAVNQGLLLGILLGTITTVVFSNSAQWLLLLKINKSVAKQAGEYLQAISYGIIPTYLSSVDQNFLLSIKRRRSPIVLNTLFVGSSMAIGFPLTIYKMNLVWLGYGVSSAAVLTFITGRFYLYFNVTDGVSDRNKYNLFSKTFNSGTPFSELIGLSFPSALQAISEWLPTMLIAIITAHGTNAQDTLEAEDPSMQMLIVLNQILLGLGTAATVSVANALGTAHACAELKETDNEILWKKNARTTGYANLVVTTLVTLPPALLCTLYPDPIVKLFSNNASIFPLACTMLRVTGATLLMDGIRNTTTGVLLGKKKRADNFFTATTNLAITGAAATAAGYFTQNALDSTSFFICRMLGISITTALLLYRWDRGSKTITQNHTTTISNNLTRHVP